MKEIKLRKDYLGEERIETIYFGGGTPSLLEVKELALLLQSVRENYKVSDHAEVTIETNPDDITVEKLSAWKQVGINRLSIGIQSFFEEDLRWMNRAHDAQQALECIKLSQKHGFPNITIDLIFGGPTLSDEHWRKNVETALSLNIPHLSCYALTVEPSTALHTMIAKRKTTDVDPEQQARQFTQLMNWLEAAGYEHYEISNFAKAGFRSRHNSSYWQGKKYLGLGPSAHSFDGNSRQWNISNNALYIKALQNNLLEAESETLTRDQRLNEFLMIRLRTMEGINLDQMEGLFGVDEVNRLKHAVEKYVLEEKVKLIGNFLYLTKKGKLFADGIASELFK